EAGQQGSPRRAPFGAGDLASRRRARAPLARPGPGPGGGPGLASVRAGAGSPGGDRGGSPRPAVRGRRGGLPDRAGGADQRGPPRRGGHRHGAHQLRRGGGHREGGRRGPGARRPPEAGQRQRNHRHAGTGARARRRAVRRSPPRGRLPGPGPVSDERCPMIRVLLADDQALVRAGFRALLDAQEDIEVIGEASDGEQAARLARQLTPDVVLMDIRMPGTDGLAATQQITADPQLAGVRVVILTTFELDEYVFEAIRSGASGFLVKDTEPDELVQAVRVVAGGDALLSPSVTRRLIAEFAARAKQPHDAGGLGELTDREQEVLALVGDGLSTPDMPNRLSVPPPPAKTHVSRAMIKLQARDRAQLVVIAYESGLVRPGWRS